MKQPTQESRLRFPSLPRTDRVWSAVVLYQLALGIAFVAGLRLLDSPSTFAFFAFELAAALVLGLFAYFRTERAMRSKVTVTQSLADERDLNQPRLAPPDPEWERDSAEISEPGSFDLPPPEPRQILSLGTFSPLGTEPRLSDISTSPSSSPSTTRRILASLIAEGRQLLKAGPGEKSRLMYANAAAEANAAAASGDLGTSIRVLSRANAKLRLKLYGDQGETRQGAALVPRKAFLVLSSTFALLMGLAVMELSRGLYTSPLGFYLALGAACGVVGVNAYLSGENRTVSVLVQVFTLATLVKFYFFFLNPYVYTSDTFLYYSGLRELEAGGYIPLSLGHYAFFPTLGTFAFAAVTATGVPLELYGAFVFLAQMGTVPVTYLIGRHVANRRVGLFAALFAVFWTFGFLWAHYGPSQYGLLFILLALYSVMRLSGGNGRAWFAIFWVAALGALLSHPINALVLAVILVVRYIWFAWRERTLAPRSAATPASAYAVAYGSYLAFVALTTFALFVQTFFVRDTAPPLATTILGTTGVPYMLVIQSALAPLSMAIPIFFAGYAILVGSRGSRAEHGFFVLLGAVFLVVAGLEFLLENFKFQSSRLLVYLVIPLVFLAAHGVLTIGRRPEKRRRVIVLIFAVFLTYGFLSSTSYLNQTDSRILYPDLPFTPTHITASAMASRQFLGLMPEGSAIYMDPATAHYFEESSRARDALIGYRTFELSQINATNLSGVIVLNTHFLQYGAPLPDALYGIAWIEATLLRTQSHRLYDSGQVRIYAPP